MGKISGNDTKTFVQERQICPICGSARIESNGRQFVCTNCQATFASPKKIKVDLRREPRYIG